MLSNDDVLNVPRTTKSFRITTVVTGGFLNRVISCQLFLLAMSGHAGPILINFGVAPVVLRIS